MDEYGDLSDKERRKLYRDFSKAAKEIRVGEEPSTGSMPEKDERGRSAATERSYSERLLFHRRTGKRPRYALRLKIESYAYSEGFEISGLRQFFASIFSFLWPSRDRIASGFAKVLVRDSAYRGDPGGYSLIRTLLELQKLSDSLLRGGSFLRRDSDKRINLRADMTRDLMNWEPAGYRLLLSFQKIHPRLLEALDYIRSRFESQASVDVYDLVDAVKGVYRFSLSIQAEPEILEEHLLSAAELIKGMYKRIYSAEDTVRQVCTRIDQQVAEFLACYSRLKGFALQLYPALLKMINRFRRQEQVGEILAEIYSFVGLNRKDVLSLNGAVGRLRSASPERRQEQRPGRVTEADRAEEEKESEASGEPFDFNEEFRGILTVLDYAFPGCRINRVAEGEYSTLLWFHSKIFTHRDYQGSLVVRKPGITDLLWKMSARDPLAAVLVFHELIAQMLESLNPEVLVGLVDPIRGYSPRRLETFVEARRQWRAIREELLLRYLKEIDYFEKEISLRGQEVQNRFLSSPAGRKTIETINQIRNHVIRGYGHVALSVDRRQYFRCRPLYAVLKELHDFLGELAIGRGELSTNNPVILQHLDREDLIAPAPGPLMRQVQSYIEARPEAKRLLEKPRAETNRVFLEILFGLIELFHFLVSDERSPLRGHGAEVIVAGADEQALRNEIDNDRTPLRVDLKKDFEEIDRLTGLFSKNEYLRFMPVLFAQAKQSGSQLSVLVMDIDNFKAINDTRGHDFGDEVLKLVAEVVLSSARDEDLSVRFGGDEILVVVKGDGAAALGLAERICGRYRRLLGEGFQEQLGEIPALMAQRELAEKKNDPLYRGGLEDFLERWKGRGVGTLSLGAAQGLGEGLPHPCGDEKELFRRADRMLYLVKDAGGNEGVAMIDEIGVPLTWGEYTEYLEYLEQIPESERTERAKMFVDLRLAHQTELKYWRYPFEKYLESET